MIILFCCISLLVIGTSVYSDNTKRNLVNVQILGLNDLHGQLNTYQDLFGQKVGGAEYVAAYINKFKNEQKHTLLVHAGDMVGASPPISALYKDEPTIEFLNQLNVEIGTLGNHEFDQGVKEMNRLLQGDPTSGFEGSKTTYISSNVINKKTNTPLLPPYIVKEIDGIKIGFIGVLTTETNDYVIPKNREQVLISDEVTAINQSVEQLIDEGVKSIIVLAHVSAKSNLSGGNPENAMVKMAPHIHDEVDVIFAGHSHSYANTLVDNKLIVQGYSYGKAISQVQLQIDSLSGEIVNKEANIHLTFHSLIDPDKETMKLISKYESMLSKETSEIIITIPKSISKKPDKDGNSQLAEMVATSMMNEMDTDMAFTHHGGIRISLNKGKITTEDIYRTLPFDHKVVKKNLTGSQIKKVLEQQWKNDKENLLQPAGISYTINHEAMIGEKIQNLMDKNGNKLEPSKVYSVAISDYLAFGGDGFSHFNSGEILSTGSLIRDSFVDYLNHQKLDNKSFVSQ
jgi:5'-nucleotidase